MMDLTHARFISTASPFPERHHSAIVDAEELANVLDMSNRETTGTIIVENGKTGALLAYAVVGMSSDRMVTIYAARVFMTGLGKYALKGLIGSAEVIGQPLRVHMDEIAPYARLLGVENIMPAKDADGIPMGVFHGK